ncbi:nucleotidyl transferase AbiEii/AbiGii toxin family protein [Patescibacteria group bacterium]|nr:nucleotidyl transferase AbiEii/AbiGii toxin family protein [Patescibacteria group bacterium]
MLKKSIELHLNILDENRLAVFKRLQRYKRYGYLAGGTALALQIGHRISYDFDVFCNKKLTDSLINNCRKDFAISQVLVNSEDEFTFLTKEQVKITFLYYPFVFHGKTIETKISLPLLNVLNIATAKAYALNRRGSWRDYVDLYFIMQNKLADLQSIIDNGNKVYGELFSPKLFLGQLVYLDDIRKEERDSINFVSGNISEKKIKEYFESAVKLIIADFNR